ncbi:ABC transporter substrate-binding protein [Catenovulum sediminis]|uniref:ABC transporter substrate-binding protein n=1 Tax=Catenovulum sediminis TaxID=1740262 RepID=UPI00117D9176|nr:cobalamin-binding protein [Catenovulum sediminis]
MRSSSYTALSLALLLALILVMTPALIKAEEKKLKLIALAPHIVEMLYSIDAGDMIIGTTEHSDYPESAKDIPRIGNYAGLQIERILQLKPDYIIAWATGNPPDDLERIKKLGIPVVYSKPSDLKSVAQELQMLGKITGKQQQAKKVIADYYAKLKVLQAKYQQRDKVDVFYQLWSTPLTTIANQAWPQKLLELCGVNNPFKNLKGDYPHISLEHVLLAKPQMIIIPTSASEPNGAVQYWTKYKTLPAVQNNQVVLVNSDKLHLMTPRALDELAIMCEKVEQARQTYQH